ncbi:MAG: nuclease-related domain-containing protein [Verrucomicrobiota bacterium]|nr:nuclease-related domain-containing protein [Verrucomicrobiota bacterium]
MAKPFPQPATPLPHKKTVYLSPVGYSQLTLMNASLALFIVPFVLLISVLYIWRWRHTSNNRRSPVNDKLLRAPGEWLMEQQGNLNEKVSLAIIIILFGPSIILATATINNNSTSPNYTMLVVAYGVICVFALIWLWCLLDKFSNYKLGLMGERATGEELNKLMLDGCHVYHDFKKDHGGNIDHVVVAPSGVYCVETKCRRKSKGLPDRKEHEVVFDGEKLHYPHGSDSFGVDQTIKNSGQLSQWLSSAVGEKIYVKGILTFPGWLVTERKMAKNLRVLNPKLIRNYIASQKEKVLDPKLTQQIVHQLEQRCRNVEM